MFRDGLCCEKIPVLDFAGIPEGGWQMGGRKTGSRRLFLWTLRGGYWGAAVLMGAALLGVATMTG